MELHTTQGLAPDKIEFFNCNPTVKTVIQIVADYSQLDTEPGQLGGGLNP